jgi:4-aminobutyrate aminotransferase-like enzyme
MTTSHAADGSADSAERLSGAALQRAAHRHMWLHFTRMSSYHGAEVPLIVRGSGQYVYDQHGKRYLDGLSGLFVSQIGHGRKDVAEAAARQGWRESPAYEPCGRLLRKAIVSCTRRLSTDFVERDAICDGFTCM